MKLLFFILFFSIKSFSQDSSVKVKIKSIKTKEGVTTVKMKTIVRPRVKLTTRCECIVPYRRGDVLWIRKDLAEGSNSDWTKVATLRDAPLNKRINIKQKS